MLFIYLSCWFAFTTKEIAGNQNSEWSESLNGDIHWNINAFQARKSKCYISIVEDGNWEKLFSSGQIESFGSRVSHSSPRVYKQRSSQLLIYTAQRVVNGNNYITSTLRKWVIKCSRINVNVIFIAESVTCKVRRVIECGYCIITALLMKTIAIEAMP